MRSYGLKSITVYVFEFEINDKIIKITTNNKYNRAKKKNNNNNNNNNFSKIFRKVLTSNLA